MPPATLRSSVRAGTWTWPLVEGGAGWGAGVLRAGPSAGRGGQLVLTQTFPGLASGPSSSLKPAAPSGGRPRGRAAPGSPWDDPWPLRGLGRGADGGERGADGQERGEAQWLEAPPAVSSGTKSGPSPLPGPWSPTLGAEPGWSLGPQSLLLHAPTWNLLRVLVSACAIQGFV